MLDRKIIDYIVLESSDVWKLRSQVKKYINEEGWQPLGGVSHSEIFGDYGNPGLPSTTYAQGMVRYDESVS